jgi:hypothetical protein
LGLANYFRKFLKDYSTLAAPLTNLTRKSVAWDWSPACQTAFNNVKEALTNALVLAMPDYTSESLMEVTCDASIKGIGAVLTQNDRPIAFESRRLTPTEEGWTTTDQELWAVVQALTVWRCHLEGVKFVVRTDHHPFNLPGQPTQPIKEAGQMAGSFVQVRFVWKHIPGTTNPADPLSEDQTLGLTSLFKVLIDVGLSLKLNLQERPQ